MNRSKTLHRRIAILALLTAALTTWGPSSHAQSNPSSLPTDSKAGEAAGTQRILDGGLRIIDRQEGSGPAASAGNAVAMNYSGWLYDDSKPEGKGKPFDSSVGRAPFGFMLGARKVIEGWERGVVGMKAGGKRTLIIPPALGYGNRDVGNGLIPAGSTLIFDVELIKILN